MRAKGLASLLLALGVGCQSIAGIEDRHFEEEGSAECQAYCDTVMSACKGDFAAYPDRKHCVKTCSKFRNGEIEGDNSLECRAEEARLAKETDEPASHCPAAGAFGAGQCGSTCAAYCSLLTAFCPEKLADIKDCPGLCAGIATDARYKLSDLDHGDDIECRVGYVIKASVDPVAFCGGAAMKSDKCVDPPDNAPSCEEYCNLESVACTADLQDYESIAQCVAYCEKLPKGTNADTTGNTVGCRKYHSYNSLSAPGTHCAHAGLGGDGDLHCGASCGAYCSLAKSLCDTQFTQAFGDAATCASECAKLDGAAPDTWKGKAPTGNTLRCRMRGLARVAAGGQNCDEVVGGSPCAPPP